MRQQKIKMSKKHPHGTDLDSPDRYRRFRCLPLLPALLLGACLAIAIAEEPAGKDLRAFFQQNCVRCHGVDGSAVGADGKKLKGQDMTDESWRQTTDDDEMVHTILHGKFFGLAMPKFKKELSKEEAERMVTEIIRKTKKGVPVEPEKIGRAHV